MFSTYKIFSFYLLLMLSVVFFLMSCNDDEALSQCEIVTSGGETFEFNGAQVNKISDIYDFNEANQFFPKDSYYFQLSAFPRDCDTLMVITINIEVEAGTGIDGIFDISPNREVGKANGNVLFQIIEAIEESQSFFASGTLTITQLGEREFTLLLDGITTDGNSLQLDVTNLF